MSATATIADVTLKVASASPAELVDLPAAADKALDEKATRLADMLGNLPDDALQQSLGDLGGDFLRLLSGSDPKVETEAARIVNAPESFQVMVKWLTHALAEPEPESEWSGKAGALLRLTAQVATQMPTAFVKS